MIQLTTLQYGKIKIQSEHSSSYITAGVPCEDYAIEQSDQSFHISSEGVWILGYPQSALRRL